VNIEYLAPEMRPAGDLRHAKPTDKGFSHQIREK